MLSNWKFNYSVNKLDDDNIEEFSLNYINFISKKHNSLPIDIDDWYKKRSNTMMLDEYLYIRLITENWEYLSSAIQKINSVEWKKTLQSCMRAISDFEELDWISIWNLLEFVCYKVWDDVSVDQFCKWKAPNWYWEFAWKIWIPLHKLEQNFHAYISKSLNFMDFDCEKISQNTLFFTWIEWNKFRACDLFLVDSEKEELYRKILEKRWYLVNSFYI